MEHTEGKWEFKDSDDCIIIVGGKIREYIANVQIRQIGGGAIAESMIDRRKANAKRIVQCVNSHDGLVKAVNAQHEAIDRLFALLISIDDKFLPSKSGQPWEAIKQGQQALAGAETEYPKQLSPQEAHGIAATMPETVKEICEDCGGRGYISTHSYKSCGICDKWMKKAVCPNEPGLGRGGPSASSAACNQFTLNPYYTCPDCQSQSNEPEEETKKS